MYQYVIFPVFLFFCLAGHSNAQQETISELQNGDLVFQNSECGPLCKDINEVTPAISGKHYAHIGIVAIENNDTFVIEATGDKVQKNTLKDFLARTPNPELIGRLQKPYRHLIDSAVAFAKAQIGVPYDHAFLYNNGKYYCAELVYDAFKVANQGKAFFQLQPMTFKKPGAKAFFPGWVAYYKNLNMPIPEGRPGCNPGSIGQSKKIQLYRYTP